MSEGYYPILNYDDYGTIEEKLQALYNTHNWLTREMSVGRVPENKKELQNNIDLSNIPLSIAFVTLAEKGEIDEVTASENLKMFLSWGENVTYNAGDLRTYSIEQENEEGITIGDLKLYKCLQAHTSQADWAPDVSPALWKVCGISENGIPEWSQPISTSDAYMTGDEVMYNGVHYRSIIDNNVWSPADYPQGWEVVE